MKIAIVVGHNSKAQGAVRCSDGRTEFDWNGHLATLIAAHDPKNVRVFRREYCGGYSSEIDRVYAEVDTWGAGYSREIDRVYAEVDAWGAGCSIELHFNSSIYPKANGGLTLSSGSTGSLILANLVRPLVSKVMGNTDRGIRKLSRHDRGGRSLWQGRCPAIMAEPYFGSNAAECLIADQHKDELAEAYFLGASRFLSK